MAELLKKEKLHLIQGEKIEFPDREDATKNVVQFKYVFLTPTGEVRTGYRPDDKFMGLVEPSGEYEEKSAKLWYWAGREWRGTMKFTLSGTEPKPVK